MKNILGKKLFLLIISMAVLWSSTACSQRFSGMKKQEGYLSSAPDELSSSDGNTQAHYYDDRKYNLYTPNSAADKDSVPLLLVLHGGLGNAEFIEKSLGMNPVADKYGFRVAYLNGTEGKRRILKDKRTWNAGQCCGVAAKEGIDDVGYITGVIDELVKYNNIDPKTVYIMGHSNGSMMAYRYACQKPEKIAALVAVSGSLETKSCSSAQDVQILHVHGKNDHNVPYKGGYGEKSITKVDYRSVDETRRILEKAGAKSYDLMLVDGAGHHLHEINSALLKNTSKSVAETAAEFFMGKARR